MDFNWVSLLSVESKENEITKAKGLMLLISLFPEGRNVFQCLSTCFNERV